MALCLPGRVVELGRGGGGVPQEGGSTEGGNSPAAWPALPLPDGTGRDINAPF